MPWCPKCNNEYREGIKICADCGCELTDEDPESLKPLVFGGEAQMKTLQKFLEYNKMKQVVLKHDASEEQYELWVPAKDWQKAAMLKNAFLEQVLAAQKAKAAKQQGQDEAEEAEPQIKLGRASITEELTVYVDSADQALESRSSAGVLLVVGGLGLLACILCMYGIVPLNFSNTNLVIDLAAGLFLVFVILGALAIRKAEFFTMKAKSEDSLRDTILKWCRDYLSAAELDAQLGEELDVSAGEEQRASQLDEGILYFKRTELLKDRINHQFMNLDQAFLDHFIDEQAYDAVFGEADR